MTKEISDLAWSILPKEFKEAVRNYYDNSPVLGVNAVLLLENLFGIDNLTSDAEGEDEMLYVSCKRVQETYKNNCDEIRRENISSSDKDCYEYANEVLKTLFGSKCLPDEEKFSVGDIVVFHPFKTNSFYDAKLIEIKEGEDKPYLLQLGNKEEIWAYPIEVQSIAETYPKEPKPAEPKFKKGDIAYYACSPTVKHKCAVTKVMQNEHSGKWEYNVMFEWGKPGMWIPESDLEPYTEPKEEFRNLSQETANCDKQFDNILKDSFSKERRLNIAAMIAQGIMANSNPKMVDMNVERVVDLAILTADTLIAECNSPIN